MKDWQKRATYKYKENHIKRITLDLNYEKDAEIILWLSGKPNKTAAIKDALRPTAEAENLKNGIIIG